LILCVYAIRKNTSKQKKTLFYFKIFTYRGEKKRKDERVKAGNKDKEQCTHRINSNLPGGSIAGERVLFFANREIHPSFTKKQYQK